MGEDIANDIANIRLISKLYVLKTKTKTTNDPIKYWAKDLNRHFSKEAIQRPIGT